MRNKGIMMTMAATLMAIESTNPRREHPNFKGEPTPDYSKSKYKEMIKKRDGVQEYEVNGKIILARSYKNALKKANK